MQNSGLLTAHLRFHTAVGIRVALRVFAPVLALFFAALYLLRPELFIALLTSIIQSGPAATGLVFAALALLFAKTAARRICLGLGGWMRHLPVSGTAQRRLAALSCTMAMTPVLIILALMAGFVRSQDTGQSGWPLLAGLPLLGVAASQAVLPVRRKGISHLAAGLACLALGSGLWPMALSGVFLIVLSDLAAGRLSWPRRKYRGRPVFSSRLSLPGLIVLRAFGFRLLIPPVLAAAVLALTSVFVTNNVLGKGGLAAAVRFGGMLSLTLLQAVSAHIIAIRRPPWPWFRSLPVSSEKRVLDDALFLSLISLPFLLFCVVYDPVQGLVLSAFLPALTLVSSRAIRRAHGEKMGALGPILLLGTLGALAAALTPWTAFLALPMAPWLFRNACRADRTQRVSRWSELHHLAAGDTLSWSGE